MSKSLTEVLVECEAEYNEAKAQRDAAEVRLRKAKERMAPLTHLLKAIQKIPPEAAEGLSLSYEDGEVVQEA